MELHFLEFPELAACGWGMHVGVPCHLDLEVSPLSLEMGCPPLPGERNTDIPRWETLTMPSKLTSQ